MADQSLTKRILKASNVRQRPYVLEWSVPARGFYPQRVRDLLDEAKRNKYTLKSQVVAVGPNFDEGMNNLDIYSKILEKYENKWLTNDLTQSWTRTFWAMCDTGLWDVIHAVQSAKPNSASDSNSANSQMVHAFGTSHSEVIKKAQTDD